jgi:uncharacterized membrane-anchored protein YhcB (DUF1043 family)
MSHWGYLVLGIFIGVVIGTVVMSLVSMAKTYE